MQLHEHIIYPINLPKFLLKFKNNIINFLVPKLISLKQSIQNENISQQNDLIITIIFAFVIVYLMQLLVFNLFFKRPKQPNMQTENNLQLQRELFDLKKQLKSLQTSFEDQSKALLSNSQGPKYFYSQKNAQNVQTNSKNQDKSNRKDEQIVHLWYQLAPLYKNSLQSNKKLALYIMQTQQVMIKQIKKLKKSKNTSSGVKTSTIRSKTADKKLYSMDKSPVKPVLKTQTIPIKKYQTEIKSGKQMQNQKAITTPRPQKKRQIKIQQQQDNQPIVQTKQPTPKKHMNQQRFPHPVSEQVQQKNIQNQNNFKSQTETLINGNTQVNQSFTKQKTVDSRQQQQGFVQDINGSKQDYVQKEAETRSQIVTDKYVQEYKKEKQETPVVVVPPKPPIIKKMNPPKTGMRRAPPPPPRR